ncbi:telomere repeat-binding protein 6 [Phtheirospermum japonicum]|uniref:Telomere repeat-binding protein 6 n=1 Tax=Phtheirospermum japonicum TaxID=374723 RepID=A0A830BJW6_9LAMI|nr:telomere repeat-binding protein 6 [Phtheirospermum japonicum]
MAYAANSMETIVDIVGNEVEAGVRDISLHKTADPVVYQLVRVDGDGRLVPATEDDVIAVEDLLEDDKSKSGTTDIRRTLECSTSYECGPCGSDKVQFIGSEGQSELEVPKVDTEKPNTAPITAVDSEETDVQHEEIIPSLTPNIGDVSVTQSGMDDSKTSNSPLGTGLKPDFSLLNGEINLENLTVKDLQETFKATFGRETSVKDKQWLKRRIIMGLTNSCDFSTTAFVIIDNRVVKKDTEETCKTADCSVLVDCVITSAVESHERSNCNDEQNETHAIEENCESKDADTGERPAKRVRKPTKRFIEEHSEGESRDSGEKIASLVKHPANNKPSAKACARPVQDFGLDGKCLTRKDSLGGSGIQIPYVSRIRRSRPRENFMTLMKFQPSGLGSSPEKNADPSSEQLDNESRNKVLKKSVSPRSIQEPADASFKRCKPHTEKKTIHLEREVKQKNTESYKTNSSDDEVATVTTTTTNGGMRRKHHRPWTLNEVVKLVEGVAKYGAGRWSEIKRVAFASYSYRTSVDLKDKWRNLLRASLAESPTGNGMASSRKQTSVPIPASILSRVRELSDMQAQAPPTLSSGKLPGFNDSNRAVQETSSWFL